MPQTKLMPNPVDGHSRIYGQIFLCQQTILKNVRQSKTDKNAEKWKNSEHFVWLHVSVLARLS